MLKIIGFDGEFAVHEMLELAFHEFDFDEATTDIESINDDSREVFHQYFKPRTETEWYGSIKKHKITPRRVAHCPPITRFGKVFMDIIKSADLLVGFDLENDFKVLRNEGYELDSFKPVVDIKDFYWLLHGQHEGVTLDNRKGLEATVQNLGMEFDTNKGHTASYDTLMTMRCFLRLLKEYARQYPQLTLGELINQYQTDWYRDSDAALRKAAKGYVSLIPAIGGYRLKSNRDVPEAADAITIPVNAKRRAINELDAMFDKRRSKRNVNIYVLRESDIEKFKSYSNEYDSQEGMHKKFYEARIKLAKQTKDATAR